MDDKLVLKIVKAIKQQIWSDCTIKLIDENMIPLSDYQIDAIIKENISKIYIMADRVMEISDMISDNRD